MQSATSTAKASKKTVWGGRIISALPALLLLFTGSAKLMKVAPVVQGFAHFGLPASLMVTIGILEVGSAIVYIIPRTAVLGAILMTGFLGAQPLPIFASANRGWLRWWSACWCGQALPA